MTTPTPQSLFLAGVPRPKFTETDPSLILEDVLSLYETLLSRKLYPAQLERLLANLQAFQEAGVRGEVQYTGEQSLVAFADGTALDYLGQNIGTYRLSESPSETTIRFTYNITEAGGLPNQTVQIDEGSQITIGGSAFQLRWETVQSVVILGTDDGGPVNVDELGNPYVEVPALCSTPGTATNGFDAGEINTFLNPVPFVSASNITQASQGAAGETDERFRERILLAPYLFSGGHINSYKAYVRAVSASITDVGVIIPAPGTIYLYPLTETGAPNPGLLLEISKELRSQNANRPITDDVVVLTPEVIPFDVELDVYLYEGAAGNQSKVNAETALNGYLEARAPSIGRDIVPSQIIDAVSNVGTVYRVVVRSPSYQELTQGQWAQAGKVEINIAGFEEG